MTERSKENLMKYWPLVLGVLMLAGTYFAMRSHMSNNTIHKDENEHVLTNQEYEEFIYMKSVFKAKLDVVESNENRIIEIEKQNAVHESEYLFLLSEHEDLENKHSRDVNALKEDLIKK